MEINWQVTKSSSLKQFLLNKGISQRLYLKLKQTQTNIYVNQYLAKPDTLVQPGDQVVITLPAENQNHQMLISNEPITILYEDQYWLVVNKPAGLASIPGPTTGDDTLLNRILGYFAQCEQADLFPHLITRLDFDTSGVILVAKHQIAQSMLQPQIEAHLIQKQYLALVAGELLPKSDEIQLAIGKQPEEKRRIVTPEGQAAKTSYQVLSQNKTLAFVKLQLHTGRTHQIRVHMSAINHPLIGDQLYGGPMTLGIQRQALHAFELKFTDPFTQQIIHIKAPLPFDIKEVLEIQGFNTKEFI